MLETAKTIGVAVITNGIVLSLFIYVFKKCFDKFMDKKLEAYKIELDLENKKHFHKYGKIYNEQADVIKNTYSMLVYIKDKMDKLVSHYNLLELHPELFEQYRIPKDGDSNKWSRYYKAISSEKPEEKIANELAKYILKANADVRKCRIYFKNDVANEIERYLFLVWNVASFFENVSYRDSHDFKPVVNEEVIRVWKEAVGSANALFPAIEEIFREYIGLNTLDA